MAVSLSAVSGQAVTVPYTVTGGTAVSGVNYVLANGTLTIPAGIKTEDIPLAVLDDGIVDASSTVKIALAAPTNATLGTNANFTYTILNADPLISVAFASSSASGQESKSASLQVKLSAAATKTVTVHYAVTGGTALGNGVDYTLKPGTLTFKPGTTTQTITIPTVDDKIYEANETIIVALSSPSNAKLGGNTTFTYTIQNIDPQPSVAFTTTTGSGQETLSNPNVSVSLSAASSQVVTVHYVVSGGSAVSGVNYTLSAGTLTFTPGSKTASFPLTILDGSPLTSSLKVQVTLSAANNATLGTTNQVFTYTILATPAQAGFDTTPPVILPTTTYSATTGDLTVSGIVSDNFSGVSSLQAHLDGGTVTTVSVGAGGQFSVDLPLGQPSNGGHTLYLTATDHAGNALSTTQPLPIFDLSQGSDTGTVGDHSTSDATATLTGTAPANATLFLVGTNVQTLASSTGAFQFPNIALAMGSNPFTIEAKDSAGNTGLFTLTIMRTAATTQPNAVLLWNAATLNAIQTDGSDPEFASRALAMVQAAVYDSVNSVDGTPAYYVKVAAPADSSIDAAVDAAAYVVLSSVYPAQQATFNTLMTSQLALLPTGQGTTDGESVGKTVGDAIIGAACQRRLAHLCRLCPWHGAGGLAADGTGVSAGPGSGVGEPGAVRHEQPQPVHAGRPSRPDQPGMGRRCQPG